MSAPQKVMPLILYLTSTLRSIAALLVEDIDGAEHPVYHISKKVQGAEERYTSVKRRYLALVFTTQKLHHYFLSFRIHIIIKIGLVRYLLSWPSLTGRAVRWLLALAEFEIFCITRAIK